MRQTIDIDNVRLSGQISDRVGDLLARIRNAGLSLHDEVAIPSTKLLTNICRILKREGYINGYEVREGAFGPVLVIQLRYRADRKPLIQGMRRVSRPGRRSYTSSSELPRVLGGLGIAIVSTSKGVMTSKEAAGHGIGGEVLCTVW